MGDSKGKILIVDDMAINLDILVETLGADFDISVALDGKSALQSCAEHCPDLILLDIMMPGMDGYEVCRRLKEDRLTCEMPVIFITALTDADDESKGLGLGAVDYITKPFNPVLVRARVKNHIMLKYYRDNLKTIIAEKICELQAMQDSTIKGMAIVAEYRDPGTGFHIQRTSEYVRILADRLVEKGQLTQGEASLLAQAAPLHDIGKVGISDAILFKPGKLTDTEIAEMKNHVLYGAEAIRKIDNGQNGNGFLRAAREIVEFHHEKWDGSGYQKNLTKNNIPIGARIMTIADVYDALVSVRPYKPAFSHEKAVNIIATSSGTHFDPELVSIFLQHHQKFDQVAKRYSGFGIALPRREEYSPGADFAGLPVSPCCQGPG